MSQSASQAAAFYRDVAKSQRMWTVCDDGGIPAPKTRTGRRSMPVWSSLSRVQRIIRNVPEYAGFRPKEISFADFIQAHVPDLKAHRMLVGVNWSGKNAVGYDLEPQTVVDNVLHLIRSVPAT